MKIIYKLTVYENNAEYLTILGVKTVIFSTINDIMNREMNKDITFNIKMAQK